MGKADCDIIKHEEKYIWLSSGMQLILVLLLKGL